MIHRPAGRARCIRAMGGLLTTLFLLALLPAAACAWQTDAGAGPEAALRAGRYDEAIAGLTRRVEASPGEAAPRRALVGALLEVGRYDEAARFAREGGSAELARQLGDALHARGDLAGAEAAYRRAAMEASDSLTARLRLATLLEARGEREEARRELDGFIDVYNRSESLSAADLTAVGTAVRLLGETDPQLFRDALKAYDEAIAADPADPTPRVLLGELFLEKYNSPDAQAALREVLAVNPSHPRALLAMARAKHFDGSPEAMELLKRALELSPNLVPARVMMARLLLDQEDDEAAEGEIRRALEVNPGSPEALSALAALHYLRGERAEFERVRQRVLLANPRYAQLDATVAEMAVRRRRYRDAVDLARAAVAVDSTSWAALGMLGLNELRLGRFPAARASLERAFTGDPYNVWVKNSLDLLDTSERYRTVRTPRFELVLREDEADLLGPYAGELAEEAYRVLAERYGYEPETPVRVEFYPSHADFSVRTVGLAGLGALGVSFGNVLALDSPAAREKGSFNWGSTLWHEIAHAVTLGASDHRVPRWLTEGLSVLEERRARPGWGSETTIPFLFAYAAGTLPPPSRLSEVFARPTSPAQLGHGYHYASLVAEWIEETRGIEAIRALLRGYASGRPADAVLEEAIGIDGERLDRDFDAWLRAGHGPRIAALRGPGGRAYGEQLAAAERLLAAGDAAGAEQALGRAVEMVPGSEIEPAHLALVAGIRAAAGDSSGAAEALARLAAVDENAYDANHRLAGILRAAGDDAGAAAALERAVYIFPMEIAPHQELAGLYAGLGDAPGVVRERRAVVALNPVDRAEALYQLALALRAAGDTAGARREVLRALEEAPGFARAQELLLDLGPSSDDGAGQ